MRGDDVARAEGARDGGQGVPLPASTAVPRSDRDRGVPGDVDRRGPAAGEIERRAVPRRRPQGGRRALRVRHVARVYSRCRRRRKGFARRVRPGGFRRAEKPRRVRGVHRARGRAGRGVARTQAQGARARGREHDPEAPRFRARGVGNRAARVRGPAAGGGRGGGGSPGAGEVPLRASGGRRGRVVLPVQGAVRGALAGGAQPAAGSAVVHPGLLGRDPGERDGDPQDQARRRLRPQLPGEERLPAPRRARVSGGVRVPQDRHHRAGARQVPQRGRPGGGGGGGGIRRRAAGGGCRRERRRASASAGVDRVVVGGDSGQARSPLERARDGASDSGGFRCRLG